MKIVKNKYLVLRALREHYSADGGIDYSSTTRELAKVTGLKEAQALTTGRGLVNEKLAREIQTKRTIKAGSRTRTEPVVGFVMTRDGANELDAMNAQLQELGVEL
jgi:hypothetical protein